MRHLLLILLILPIFSLAQVGVNTTSPNAMLDVTSTNNGVLIPRVQLSSTADNSTITNPAGGAVVTSTLVYNMAAAGVTPNNVVAGFYYWNNTISRWIPIAGTAGWELDGNTAITTPATPTVYGTTPIGATETFLGTTDNNDVTIGTNTIERMRVKSTTGNVGIGTAAPTEKLHVFENSNANKSLIFGDARQATTGADYQNIGVKGYGRGTTGWGYGNGVMGIGDTANSYFATGVYAHLGTTAPLLPATSQALYANGNSLGNAGIFMGGNVGIGTATPTLARLQVDAMAGNTTALFRGNSTTSQGISMVADWPGIYFNSYYNGGIRSMAGSGYTSIINTDQASGGLAFQTTNVVNPASGTTIATVPTRMTITGAGNVGIGTTTPSRLLHVNSATSGAVRIVDGTQANGRVLTSDATGVGTWQATGIDNIVGVLSGTGANIAYNQTVNFVQTGSYIVLPPGRYAVNVTMLLARNSTSSPSPNNSFFWVRSSFSDSNGANPSSSPDIVGSTLASGNFGGTSVYAMLNGSIIINNTTAGNKTYYYVAGRTVTSNTTETLTGFGSTYWAEDNIIAYRLN